jgi:iron complex outermembrane receptor protein
MHKILMGFVAVFITAISFAQAGRGKATATILNDQKAAVEGATVELLRSQDSALAKTSLSDKAGVAEFDNVKPASYLLRVTAVGLNKSYSNVFEVKENRNPFNSSNYYDSECRHSNAGSDSDGKEAVYSAFE